MKKAWNFLYGIAGLVLLGALAVGLVLAFQAIGTGGEAGTASTAVSTSQPYPPPQGYPPPQATLPAPEATAIQATRIAQATAWEAIEATRIVALTASAPSPIPTPGPLIGPQTIHDPSSQFTLTLLSGWHAWVGGTTVIVNYDDENLGSEGDFPPGGLKIQIGIGKLPAGQTFEQWQAGRIALETSPVPEDGWPGQTATELLPYTLGRYEGFSYFLSGPPRVFVIHLPLSNERVMGISLMPADSLALEEALVMLSTVEISPQPLP